MTEPTSQADRAISGDPEAIRALWESHRRWLAAVVLAHMPRGAELEDLLQEVAMRIVRQVHHVRDPAAIRPWMRSVAVNVARTAGRRRIPRLRLVDPSVDPADAPAPAARPVAHALGAAEEGRRALDAAMRLKPEYREPLILQCVRGLSYKQIADVLGVPVTTIETRLARARRMVREELEREALVPTAGV